MSSDNSRLRTSCGTRHPIIDLKIWVYEVLNMVLTGLLVKCDPVPASRNRSQSTVSPTPSSIIPIAAGGLAKSKNQCQFFLGNLPEVSSKCIWGTKSCDSEACLRLYTTGRLEAGFGQWQKIKPTWDQLD